MFNAKLLRFAVAPLIIIAFFAAAMTAMALGIDWQYIVVDSHVDTIDIPDLTETNVRKHKWTASIYDRCVASAAATQLGSTVSLDDCENFADRDSCGEHVRMMGHTIVAFTILTFIFLIFTLVLAIIPCFMPNFPLVPVIGVFVVDFVFSVLAWTPFVAYRYGQIPGCDERHGAPWCTAGARKCRFYGFGFMVTVTCLSLIATIVGIMMRKHLMEQANATQAAKDAKDNEVQALSVEDTS